MHVNRPGESLLVVLSCARTRRRFTRASLYFIAESNGIYGARGPTCTRCPGIIVVSFDPRIRVAARKSVSATRLYPCLLVVGSTAGSGGFSDRSLLPINSEREREREINIPINYLSHSPGRKTLYFPQTISGCPVGRDFYVLSAQDVLLAESVSIV